MLVGTLSQVLSCQEKWQPVVLMSRVATFDCGYLDYLMVPVVGFADRLGQVIELVHASLMSWLILCKIETNLNA